MINGYREVFATFDEPLNEFKSVAVTRVLHDFYEMDTKLGFYGGGGIDARLGVPPMGFALGNVPAGAPRWGKDYKNWLESYSRTMILASHATSLPVETNSISLDADLKDAWGLPALCMTYKDHRDDLSTTRFLRDRSLDIADAAKATKVWAAPVEQQSFAVHLLGTCRMGNDPKTSVVDANHRTHDVPNLFLCDGSSFVTSGRGQPTMTIQALAFRAGHQIAAAARRGEI